MSTELEAFGGILDEDPTKCKAETSMTQFWGGDNFGVSVQLTQDTGYIRLDVEEAKDAIIALRRWVDTV